MSDVEKLSRELQRVGARIERDRQRRDQLVRQLADLEVPYARIAKLAGITKGRAWQIRHERAAPRAERR